MSSIAERNRVVLLTSSQVVTVANRSIVALSRNYLSETQINALEKLNRDYIAKMKAIDPAIVAHDSVVYCSPEGDNLDPQFGVHIGDQEWLRIGEGVGVVRGE